RPPRGRPRLLPKRVLPPELEPLPRRAAGAVGGAPQPGRHRALRAGPAAARRPDAPPRRQPVPALPARERARDAVASPRCAPARERGALLAPGPAALGGGGARARLPPRPRGAGRAPRLVHPGRGARAARRPRRGGTGARPSVRPAPVGRAAPAGLRGARPVSTSVVTIGVVSYNRLHYLRALMESARECVRYPDVQWIVVDGNSVEPG